MTFRLSYEQARALLNAPDTYWRPGPWSIDVGTFNTVIILPWLATDPVEWRLDSPAEFRRVLRTSLELVLTSGQSS